MIKAEIIADSFCVESKKRITTMKVVMPRIVLAEFNTHRAFSRNSASSRAIPFERMSKMVQENPFIPVAWQREHKGMQGVDYFTDEEMGELGKMKTKDVLSGLWLQARDSAVIQATLLNKIGATKQLCNRLLEPFMWHTVLVTATDWDNFFALRCPQYQHQDGQIFKSWKELVKDAFDNGASRDWVDELENYNLHQKLACNRGQAEIHISLVAEAMYDALKESVPKALYVGQWHIPYGDKMDGIESNNQKVKIATARCARVSYETLGKEAKIDYEADIALHDRLAESGHWSPFEHCAQAMPNIGLANHYSGNFNGWRQYRKFFVNENITNNKMIKHKNQ